MAPDRPRIGAAAPTVELTDHHGAPWRLTDHHGAPVVLIFHRHLH